MRCLLTISIKISPLAFSLNIHYIHAKPTKTDANTKVYPMILLHGWPGSVREFYDMIPLLTTPSKDNIAFEVIAPSLPGYGWSEGAKKQGLGPAKAAVIFRNLMKRLGFEKYYVQGEHSSSSSCSKTKRNKQTKSIKINSQLIAQSF